MSGDLANLDRETRQFEPLAVVELWSFTPVALRTANTISPALIVRIAAPA